jgi:hypothetical protein
MLSDEYAQETLKKLLTQYYGGSIKKMEFVNYNPDKLVLKFHQLGEAMVGKDHLDEFQSFIKYDQTKNSKDWDINDYVR